MQPIFQKPTSNNEPGSSIEEDFMYGSNVAQSHLYIRLGFLRKVYGILSVQLLLTTAIAAAMMMYQEDLKLYLHAKPWPLFVCMFGSIGLLLFMFVKKNETPTNYILLFAFTVVEALTIGFVVIHYSVALVLQAFGLTCAVTVALTVYTFQSKRDFSHWGAALFACLWILLFAGIFQLFFRSPLLELGLAIGGAVLFSLLIIFDTAMIMHRVSPEEYIIACIDLYLDIINLFLYILRILAELKRE